MRGKTHSGTSGVPIFSMVPSNNENKKNSGRPAGRRDSGWEGEKEGGRGRGREEGNKGKVIGRERGKERRKTDGDGENEREATT